MHHKQSMMQSDNDKKAEGLVAQLSVGWYAI